MRDDRSARCTDVCLDQDADGVAVCAGDCDDTVFCLTFDCGRFDEAWQRLSEAHELEPLSAVIHTDLAMAHYFARRYDAAAGVIDALVETDPAFG